MTEFIRIVSKSGTQDFPSTTAEGRRQAWEALTGTDDLNEIQAYFCDEASHVPLDFDGIYDFIWWGWEIY